MAPVLDQAVGQFKGFWQRTSMKQRLIIGGLIATIIATFILVIIFVSQPTYRVLYANLGKEDQAKVLEQLGANNVKYKIENNGATVLVPESKVYEMRLKLAGEGSLIGQGVGFEIFDEVKVGQTDFVQKINYQRALQGELGRTIAEFPSVSNARVHLVIPSKSLFIEEQRDPTASVVLRVSEGSSVDKRQVQSIVNLVALAVEGLDKNNITVTDTNGRLLYTPKDEGSLQGMTTTQYEYKVALQQNMERRIEEMLTPVIGPGKVIARVNADLDFSHRKIHSEKFDPESAVVRSEQRSEETNQGQANLDAGVPEANFRGDGINQSVSQQQGSRETRTTNFEIDKVEEDVVKAMGDVNRLSVAVIVDGVYTQNPETEEWAYTALAEEEIQRIEQLVQSAVGYDSARGDMVRVSNIAFGPPAEDPSQNLMQTLTDYALRLGKPLLNALLVLLFLILVVRPVIMSLIKPRVETEPMEGLVGLPEGEQRLALIESDEEEFDALDALKKIEDIKAHALQLSESNLEQAVNILRSWLKQTEASRVG